MKRLKKKFPARVLLTTLFAVIFALSVMAGTFYAVTVNGTPLFPSSGKGNVAAIGAAVDAAESGDGTYTITVNADYSDAVASQTQTVEYYADTSLSATSSQAIADNGSVTFTVASDNTTPTLNLKSNAKVSVKSVVVKDENGNNITSQAFGYDQYYTDFIESCKTSLFGYLELQNITGNITVDVTYGEPIADKNMGSTKSNDPYYSITVVTKGDVGPYGKAYQNDYEYQDVSFGSCFTTFNIGDTAPSGNASGGVYSTSGHYTMRDGGQITRYDYRTNTAYFDYSYYSYISDIKMYYNDTGEKVEQLDLAGEAYTISRSNRYNGSAGRSITYVVTYKAFDNTTVYANIQTLQNKAGSKKIRLDADEGGRFADYNNSGITSSNTYTYGIDENTDPFSYVNSSGGSYGKVKALNTDSVKFYFDNEQGNSIDFRHFKVYSLDVDGNTYGEQIAGEGCEKPPLTLTYSPERTGYKSDGWVTISGLHNYDGDIYVTADTYRYNHKVSIRQSGEHTDSFTITADDAFGAISGAGQPGDDVYMGSSCTKTADEGSTEHWMYSGGKYTVKSNGDQRLQKVTLTYYPMNENYSYSARTTDTYDTKSADGSISFTFPTDSYFSQTTSDCYLTVYYEPITTYEAQVYMTASGVPVTDRYLLQYNSANMVEVSTFNDDTPSANLFTIVSGVTTTYQTKSYEKITSTGDSDIYKIAPGTKVKVKNIFKEESRAVSSTLPQSLIDFVNRRFTFKGVKVYKASNFSHNSDATATLGEELTVTQVGDDYVFTMPESGVRIVPEYEQHVRAVNILSNERNGNNTYHITQSSLGSATLTGDENNWFISKSWYDCDDRYDDTKNAGPAWTTNRILTLDSSRFTLTATPADSANYTVKAVKAYKYAYNSGKAQNNNIYQSELTATTYDWLTYDDKGNITNEEITGVVGALGDPDAKGARSCTVTLPDTLDVGNIVLWVDFEPVETTTFAHFKYEPDTTSAKPFNPIVNLKSVFTGDYASYASVSATDGADVEAAVYDEDNTQYMNVELGGNNKFRSGFYQYNLIYTIKDYANDTELAKFRVYRDQIYPVDCTEEKLNEYLVTSACTFDEVSDTSGVCEKATLRFKLPKNGITLSYQSERLYIPVTVKQYVKDANGQYQPANNDLTATLTKYFENTSNLSDFAQNKYFATDSTLTSSYGLNTAESSAFADTVTVTGAEETHYMLIENLKSWQGFYIQPSTAKGYTVSSDGIEQTSYNRLGNANTLDGYMSSDTKTYVEGSGYRVRYHAEYRSDMSLNSSDINSHMGAQSVEIKVYYEETDDLYSSVSYTPSGTFKPNTVFKGTIQYDADGVVSGTDGASMSAAVYNGESVDPKTLTMEVGGGSNSTSEANGSIFHEANLVYTLTDPNSNVPLLKFRIYRGQVEPVKHYTQQTFDKYIQSASVEGYNTDTYSALREKATVRFKVPEGGMSITYTAETPYIPVTVKQYVLDSEGSATEAGEGFTAAVTKYYPGSNEFGTYKFFAKDNTLTDSYGLSAASQDGFVNDYTVTGAGDTHYMVYLNEHSGLYVMPNAPTGYALATIRAKALNSAGADVATDYNQSLVDVPTTYNATNGYQIKYWYASCQYLRGESIEVDVYYQPTTSVTVKQTMDGVLGTGTLATVAVSNANTEAPISPYKAYINPNDSVFADSFTLNDNSANMNGTDEDNPSAHIRTTKIFTNKGTKPQLVIAPKGARNVTSVTIYKKDGGNYVKVPATDYTVTGTGAVNGSITYTFQNAVAVGDDYLVDIVYGNEMTLTVKAFYYDDGNTAQEIDTEHEYNITKLDKITVTGELTGSEGSPFVFNSKGISSFEVTYPGKTVTSFTNAKVKVNTTLKSDSSYVIANVVAYNDAKSDINLVTPQDIKDENGKSLGTSYSECKLSSLTSTDNVTLIVYLAKVADVKVSVYTIGADGVINSDGSTSFPGVPHGGMSDSAVQITNSYVDVHAVDSSNINKNAIITAADEGNYYTGNFDVTFDPYSRDVKVLQGSRLSIFAQIPNDDRGTYVVRKVVSNGTGFRDVSVGSVRTFTDTDGSSNLRVDISTLDEKIDASKTYDIKIYIEKAKTIYTRATDQGGNTETYTGGRVTVFGSNSEAGVLPFTVIKPSNVTAYNSYNAVSTTSSADYTSEAKCVRGTSLRFEAIPASNYEVSSVTVKKGQTKETATDVAFTSVAGDSGKMIYTITDPMDYTYNLYIDVVFTVSKWGKVTIDYQYSDDFVNFKYLLDPNDGLSTLSVSSYYPKVSIDKVKDGDESFNNKSDITFEGIHTYDVIAGNEFRTSTSTYKNGKWYIPAETYVYDKNEGAIRSREGSVSRTNTGIDATVREGDDLIFHIRLVPISKIGAVLINNNCYNDHPTGVKKEEEGIVTLNAHFDKQDDYRIEPPAALFNYPGCTWGNSTSFICDSDIVENSVLDTVVVDYNRTATPGKIRKVTIYEFNKGDAPSTIGYNFATADYTKAVRSWDITSHKVNDGNVDYITYNCLDGNNQKIKVKGNMEYRVVVEYDVIKVTESTNNAAYADGYVVFADSIDSVNIDNGNGDIHKLSTRLDESYATKNQNAYFVIVSKLSPTDYELNATTFYDYETQTEENILSQMQQTTRSTSGGIARYYYYWQINSNDPYPVDNSMRFYYSFNLKKENPDVPVEEENLDCNITVEQWNRDTYDGQYVAADNQSVTFSVPAEAPLKNAQTGISANPLTVTSATDFLYSNRKVKLTIHPEPYTGYNVEKVVIIDGSTGTYHPDSNGNVEHTLYNSNVTVKVYYSRPLLRISATNEGKASKAVVQVYNTTEQTTQTVLDANTFTNGVFATKGDSAQVFIKPITYTSGELTKYYTVASIRIGDTYDNTSTAYTENGGTAQGYSVKKTDDGSEFVLTIDNIQKDKYIFIQLRGDEAVLRSNLQIRQQIRFAGESEYVDCTDGYYGTVITRGKLDGVDDPLNFDETDCASYTLSSAASADGSVLFDTALSLTATPPEGYSVHSVEALMNGDNINVNLSEGVYRLDTTAPNSGTTVITVKYALPTTPYTLNYVYQGRKGGNGDASYEDDDKTDTKTYTVNAELYPSELDETGKPTYKALADYAPAVEDLYKDCTWTIDSSHVEYDTENSSVKVTAVQDVKEYVVKFYYEGYTEEPLEVKQVKLNSFATKDDGSFIEAPASDNSNDFAYWRVDDVDSPTEFDSEGNPTAYKEVAKCFDREFNLRVTGNYIVTACYGASATAITISDPEYTREQYTDASGKSVDKLYADFILAYMEENGKLLNPAYDNHTENVYKTGLILEFDGNIKLTKPDEAGAHLTEDDKAVAVYEAGDVLSEDNAKKLINNEAIPGQSSTRRYVNYAVAADKYNNHNRVDKVLSFTNSETARHMVMRAYYYVWNTSTGSFEMTEPVYFYLYEIGNSVSDTSVN